MVVDLVEAGAFGGTDAGEEAVVVDGAEALIDVATFFIGVGVEVECDIATVAVEGVQEV